MSKPELWPESDQTQIKPKGEQLIRKGVLTAKNDFSGNSLREQERQGH